MRKILTKPDKTLLKISNPVQTFDKSLKKLIKEMYSICSSSNGIGLAAIQIGELKRLFIIDLTSHNGIKQVFINPKIIEVSNETCTMQEGCLSVPNRQIDIDRPEKIKVEYQNKDGAKRIGVYDGLIARVVQHETDHLNGVLMTSK